jgi:hypothetical protein
MMKKRDFGTAKVNGKELKNQMRRRGWLPGELADMTHDKETGRNRVSERTVEKMMAGQPVRIVMIREIAGTLGMTYEELVEDEASPAPQPSANGQPDATAAQPPHQWEVVVRGNYHDLAQAARVVEIIQNIMEVSGGTGEARIIDKFKGSIRIIVETSEEDYQKVLAAFRAGKLESLGVTDIRDAEGAASRNVPLIVRILFIVATVFCALAGYAIYNMLVLSFELNKIGLGGYSTHVAMLISVLVTSSMFLYLCHRYSDGFRQWVRGIRRRTQTNTERDESRRDGVSRRASNK